GDQIDGVSFKDLGRCRLKDFGRSQHVFQVLAPGLRRDFPHLRTVGPTRGRRRATVIAAALGSAACATGVVALLVHSAAAPPRVSANHVAVIDPSNARLQTPVPVGVGPGPLVQAAGSVWVANLTDSTITRINPATGEPVK